MSIIKTDSEKIIQDANGNLISRETTTDTKTIKKNEEDTYIKIYTDRLDSLPDGLTNGALRLLLQLTKYVSYADVKDLNGGMLIKLDKQTKEEIQSKLNIGKSYYYKHIKSLLEFGLLKEINRGCYQLNPFLFGKGYYEYRPTLKQGGIKDIRDNWHIPQAVKTKTIEDNMQTISLLEAEVDKCNEEIEKATNAKDILCTQREKQYWLNEIQKISEAEYTKILKYEIPRNHEQNMRLQELQEQETQYPEEYREPTLEELAAPECTIEELEARYPEEFARQKEEMEIARQQVEEEIQQLQKQGLAYY